MNRSTADVDDEDGPVWRALPVRAVGLSKEDIVRRMNAGTDPESPEEYILRVRYEASKIPDVMISPSVNARVYDGNMTLRNPAALLSGTSELWRTSSPLIVTSLGQALAAFAALRSLISARREILEKREAEIKADEVKGGGNSNSSSSSSSGSKKGVILSGGEEVVSPPEGTDLKKWLNFCFLMDQDGDASITSNQGSGGGPAVSSPISTAEASGAPSATTNASVTAAVSALVSSAASLEKVASAAESSGDFDEDAFSSSDEDVMNAAAAAAASSTKRGAGGKRSRAAGETRVSPSSSIVSSSATNVQMQGLDRSKRAKLLLADSTDSGVGKDGSGSGEPGEGEDHGASERTGHAGIEELLESEECDQYEDLDAADPSSSRIRGSLSTFQDTFETVSSSTSSASSSSSSSSNINLNGILNFRQKDRAMPLLVDGEMWGARSPFAAAIATKAASIVITNASSSLSSSAVSSAEILAAPSSTVSNSIAISAPRPPQTYTAPPSSVSYLAGTGRPPFLSTLIQIKQVQAEAILRRFLSHFHKKFRSSFQEPSLLHAPTAAVSDDAHSSSSSGSSSSNDTAALSPSLPSTSAQFDSLLGGCLSPSESLWLYSIFATLELPLHADTSSLLRSWYLLLHEQLLAMLGGLQQSALQLESVEGGEGSDQTSKRALYSKAQAALASLRVLAVIAGDFFGQRLPGE